MKQPAPPSTAHFKSHQVINGKPAPTNTLSTSRQHLRKTPPLATGEASSTDLASNSRQPAANAHQSSPPAWRPPPATPSTRPQLPHHITCPFVTTHPTKPICHTIKKILLLLYRSILLYPQYPVYEKLQKRPKNPFQPTKSSKFPRCCRLQFGLSLFSPVLSTCQTLYVPNCGLRQQQLSVYSTSKALLSI